MAVLVKPCCFGCKLRTGATILAILDLFASTYFIYHESKSIKDYKHLEEKADDPSQDFPFRKTHFLAIKRLSYINLAFKVISFLVNLLLLASCNSDNAYLAYPWLGWNMFELFFNLGLIIFLIAVWSQFDFFLIFYGIAWLLSIYSIVVVYSFIEHLRQKPPPPGNIGQQEAPREMSTAEFPSNTHYPTGTSARFSSTSARRQPKPSGSKLTTYIWSASGGSEWGGGSEDCWGYSGGSGDCWGYSGGSGGGDCGYSGGDDGGGGGCGGGD